jgi:hypothetical protein
MERRPDGTDGEVVLRRGITTVRIAMEQEEQSGSKIDWIPVRLTAYKSGGATVNIHAVCMAGDKVVMYLIYTTEGMKAIPNHNLAMFQYYDK